MADFPAVTPADSPSDPAGYAAVAVQPMDIQAPMEDLAGAAEAAERLTGAGVLYPQGPRQEQAQGLLESPQGFAAGGGYNITAGFSGGGGDDGWPNDVEPDATGP